MNSKSSFPINLDERVIFTLIITSIVFCGLMLLSFRYNNDRNELCSSGRVFFKPGVHFTGEPIRFTAQNIMARNTVWNFGDSLKQAEKGSTVYHTFPNAGLYNIRLTIDGMCTKDTMIYITQQAVKANELSTEFFAPQTAYTGSPVLFKDLTPNAKRWEWRFGETTTVDATVQNPQYTYTTPGTKRVILVVNGNIRGEANIFIERKPETSVPRNSTHQRAAISGDEKPQEPPLELPKDTVRPQPEPVKKAVIEIPLFPSMSEVKLGIMLRQVVDGKLNAGSFNEYLCNPNIDVVYNGKPVTFIELCNNLRNIKKSRRIKSMDIKRQTDPLTNCVKSITVNVDTKWIYDVLN